MTVPSEVSKSGPYLCNGVTDVFDYDFRIVDKTHIRVILTDLDDVERDLTLTTHYTVSDVGADTGSINLTSAGLALAVSGTKVTNLRNVPVTQETDLQNQGAYYAETVEDRFDLITMQIQQVKERSDRSIAIAASDDDTTLDELTADLMKVAAISDDVSTVASNDANITIVAGISTDVSTVAGVADDIPVVADLADDIPAVAAVAADIPTVAENVADINSFSKIYLGPKAVEPSTRNDGSALVKGDLYFDAVSDRQKTWTGSAWVGGTGDMLASNNLSDVDPTLAAGNLGLIKRTTVSGLISDSILAYTAAAGKTAVTAGQIVEAGGYRYTVAASGASDHDVTTSGGVKLYVMPINGAICPEMFGAVGDGTGESSILQSVFAFSRVTADIDLTAGKTYGIGSTLTSAQDGRRISGTGTIKVLSEVGIAVLITGDNCILRDFTIQGQNLCHRGIKAPVDNVDIEGVHIFDVYSDAVTGTDAVGSFAIWTGPSTGVVRIHGNEIRRINSIGDGTSGNSAGNCRAILVDATTGAESVWVTDNLVDEIRGEDGDAIYVAGSSTKGNVFITGNKGSNVDRRFIKVQAYNATVIGNRYTQTGDLPNYPITCIGMQYVNNCIVMGNHLEAQGFDFGIAVGVSAATHGLAVVMGNIISGPSAIVGLSSYGAAFHFVNMKNIIVSGNVAENFTAWMAFLNVTGGVVSDNIWNISDGVMKFQGIADVWVDDTSTPRCSGITFRGNRAIGTGADNYCQNLFLPLKMHDSVIDGNVADFDEVTTGNKYVVRLTDTAATNLTIIDNVGREDSVAALSLSAVPSGMKVSGNRNLGSTATSQDNFGLDVYEQTADGNRIITPGLQGKEILWSGAITADRNLTVSAGSKIGAEYTITRTGAGAFNVNVVGVTNLAQNQWCKIVLGSSGWFVAAKGSLT